MCFSRKCPYPSKGCGLFWPDPPTPLEFQIYLCTPNLPVYPPPPPRSPPPLEFSRISTPISLGGYMDILLNSTVLVNWFAKRRKFTYKIQYQAWIEGEHVHVCTAYLGLHVSCIHLIMSYIRSVPSSADFNKIKSFQYISWFWKILLCYCLHAILYTVTCIFYISLILTWKVVYPTQCCSICCV